MFSVHIILSRVKTVEIKRSDCTVHTLLNENNRRIMFRFNRFSYIPMFRHVVTLTNALAPSTVTDVLFDICGKIKKTVGENINEKNPIFSLVGLVFFTCQP